MFTEFFLNKMLDCMEPFAGGGSNHSNHSNTPRDTGDITVFLVSDKGYMKDIENEKIIYSNNLSEAMELRKSIALNIMTRYANEKLKMM